MSDDETRPPRGAQNLLSDDSPRDTPFGRGFPLGRWAGVPIRAHWSVLISVGLFTFLIASVELPGLRPGKSGTAYWATGVITAVVFFIALLAHELAHAVTARHYGLRVRRISLWMLGGLTELEDEPPSPRADALIAASGPLTSLALGVGFAASSWLVGGAGIATAALFWLGGVNVLLAVFNLLPGAPLDGGRLLRALLWWRTHDRERAAGLAARAGRILGIALIGLGALEVLAGSAVGLWTAFLGWFIVSGAASERYAVRAERLHGLTVRDAMTPTPVVAPDWWTVEQFLAGLPPAASTQPVFPIVGTDGGLRGGFTLKALEMLPPERLGAIRLQDVATRTSPLLVTAPDDDLALVHLPLHLRGGLAFVVESGRPVGVITEGDLDRTSRLVELGWPGTEDPPPRRR